MKKKFAIITASGFIGGMAFVSHGRLLAIEPPPDTAEPPPALLNQVTPPVFQRPQPKPLRNIPFIGLATATVPDMVAYHLNLEQGTGVIIRTVYPDGPAEKAGLAENDIILSVSGSAVGSPEDLSSSVQKYNSGDRVAISLIHKGKPAKVEVTLSERPEHQIAEIDRNPMPEGLPQAHADRLRGLIERNLGAFGNGVLNDGIFPGTQIEDSLRMMRERMNRAMGGDIPQLSPENGNGIRFQNNSTIRMMDNQGSIEIRSSSDNTEVTVRDEKNETVWSGPWNSEKDKAAAPKDIRERIQKINLASGSEFPFRFGNPGPSEPRTLDN